MTQTIGIVADDLTGAADALAPFRAHGYACEVLLAPQPDSAATVTATVTHSRAARDEVARELTRAAVAEVIAHGRRPYLKIDSTMRGPISAQLEGALEACRAAYGEARAIVCPSYPELGRVVSEGIVYVDGTPLGESVFTADPRNPVSLSALAELLPRATPRDLAGIDDIGDIPEGGIVFVDATEGAHLDAVARAGAANPSVLLAGSAGLATACAALLPPGDAPEPAATRPARVLLVASSRHPATLQQLEHLPVDLYSVLGDDPGSGVDVPVTVLTARSRFTHHDAERVLESLARQAEAFFDAEEVDQLILIGGDGAAAVLDALDAQAISLRQARMPGHAEGVIRGGAADGISVITRAGGFGNVTTLAELLRLTLEL